MSCPNCQPWKAPGKILKAIAGIGCVDVATQRKREAICDGCDQVRRVMGIRQCGVCGCLIAPKTKLEAEHCPDYPPKW